MTALHLTFDDGPEPTLTPLVLEALRAHAARATFFVLGEKVRAAPEILDQIQADGHGIELHGDAHLDHRIAGSHTLARDTGRAIRTLTARGLAPGWWRLPWGRPGPQTDQLARRAGLRIVGWDADTHDWRGDGWDAQPDTVRNAASEGGVVLLHDGFGPGARRTDGANTIELTHALLQRAGSHRLDALALPEPRTAAAANFTTAAGRPRPQLEPRR